MRGGYNKPFTYEERIAIEKSLRKRNSLNETAILIGRSKNGVTTEVRINGGVDRYLAKEAQERAMKAKRIGRKKVSEYNKSKGISPLTTFYKRIEYLEMQVEILTDFILNKKPEQKVEIEPEILKELTPIPYKQISNEKEEIHNQKKVIQKQIIDIVFKNNLNVTQVSKIIETGVANTSNILKEKYLYRFSLEILHKYKQKLLDYKPPKQPTLF